MKRLIAGAALMLGACSAQPQPGWLGYGEGDYALIGAPQPGWVTQMRVERGATVHKGDVLFSLDATQQAASRDAARAGLAQAKAALAQEQANQAYLARELARQNALARADAGADIQRTAAQTAQAQSAARIGQLRAQIAQTEASLAGADYTLSQRQVVAQTEGPVEDIYFRPGEYVAASVPVVSVLPPGQVYVRFFVPEPELARVHLGQKLRISCDGCKDATAEVSFIAAQAEFTPPVIFSIGNREKLVFKAEARAKGGLSVHPGQPVEVHPL